MLNPNGRVIMISGANRGIGKSMAEVLATRGYTLSLGARDPGAIALDALPGRHMAARWEATEPATSSNWVDATVQQFGRIDGVVLNAGVELGGDLETGDEELFDRMWDVNFKGPLRLVRSALPALRTSGAGRVINVVSLAGKRVRSTQIFGYSASKHASIALTHAVRAAGWDDGVRATSICPGMVDTDMVAHVDLPEGQFKINPATIAETAAYALSLPNEAVVAEILVNSRFEPLF